MKKGDIIKFEIFLKVGTGEFQHFQDDGGLSIKLLEDFGMWKKDMIILISEGDILN